MNSSTPALTHGDLPSMVARQAILDRDKKLFGY